MTEELFREDAYLKDCEAKVIAVQENSIILDRTVFYPQGGGQSGDSGIIKADGQYWRVVDTQKSDHGIRHIIEAATNLPDIGLQVVAELDWERRHRLMRMHSCMHLLCSLVPFGVTGGSVRDNGARLDFDAEQPLDKQWLNEQLQQVISEDHVMAMRWISGDELDANPELVRTMSVQPPRDSGLIRLVEFDGVDLQPCGGTHVKSTAEIGKVLIRKIEKKGKHNRRVNVVFDD